MRILGIDPSNTQHAWALIQSGSDSLDGLQILLHGRDFFSSPRKFHVDLIVIEMIASYGMAVGAHTFDTCVEIGKLLARMDWGTGPSLNVQRITRVETKRIVCRSVKASDSNVRAAIIDRFGGPASIKKGGPLHGVAKDTWAAIAVALAAASGEARWYVPIATQEIMA